MSNIPTPETDVCILVHAGMPANQAKDLLEKSSDLERRLVEANEELKRRQIVIQDLEQSMAVINDESERRRLAALNSFHSRQQAEQKLVQYKTYADSEIALLKTNLEEAIREHERMATELAEAQQWIDSEPDWKDKYNAEMLLVVTERDQLKQALAHYSNHPAPHGTDWVSLEANNKRYQWLKNQPGLMMFAGKEMQHDELDDAIDAAMTKRSCIDT